MILQDILAAQAQQASFTSGHAPFASQVHPAAYMVNKPWP